jgi:hypothetical protein
MGAPLPFAFQGRLEELASFKGKGTGPAADLGTFIVNLNR